jgi:5-carboxymethyl-2-hydroxymuconate isomerase
MSLKSDNVEFVCGIVAAIMKMATGRNFSMSGINSGHHNIPTYEMALKSDNVEFVIVRFQR